MPTESNCMTQVWYIFEESSKLLGFQTETTFEQFLHVTPLIRKVIVLISSLQRINQLLNYC